MARVTGTLTGTTLATPGPPVRPQFTQAPGVTDVSAQITVGPGFISTHTTVYAIANVGYVGTTSISVAGTYSWVCPAGITAIEVECFGGGGGASSFDNTNLWSWSGGGGGAYAQGTSVPVTPGVAYTFVVGAGGTRARPGNAGTDSTFTGDSGSTVVAKGGQGGPTDGTTAAAGGSAASSTGDIKFSGGASGTPHHSDEGGPGGGASGNVLATGATGANGTFSGNPAGGVGANGGGSGGQGASRTSGASGAGVNPGGGGGGSAATFQGNNGADGKVVITVQPPVNFIGSHTVVYPAVTNPQTATPSFISSTTSVHAPTLTAVANVNPPFIASTTVVYGPQLNEVYPGFIASVTVVYAPQLSVNAPFISSHTHVWAIYSVFDPNKVYGGPGNGGEAFLVELNANGVTTTATLAADIGVALGTLTMTGDSGLPTTVAFVVTIDSEQLLISPRGSGSYRVQGRGLGNTTIATHTAGATVSWGDSYDQAIVAAHDIAHTFTADINSTGSFIYPGWLICFDSSQAYLSGDRYPMHVTSVEGVFDAGAGIGGTNRCDAAQPNSVCAPATTSDYCPAALSNPSRISSDIATGDVAVVRYTNPEASVLDLGPRAVTLQSWFGLMRVNTSNVDVTFTDPNGICVDTTGIEGTYTGSVNGVFAEPLPLQIGIAPDASDAAGHAVPTPNTVPWETVTLPGTDRKMTFGSGGGGYDRAGWPICCIAVRQGKKRVPFWQSWDWRDYNYIYTGFSTDATYAQILINRNGILFDSVPAVELPGPQDIDGPDAVWDDAAYFFGASWYVVIFNTPYLVFGPSVGGTPSGGASGGSGGYAPGVSFSGGGHTVTVPPFIEGGSGGGISPGVAGLHIWATSGKGFS